MNRPLANEKLLAAVFSEDSVKNRRNTEAVEIYPNTLIAARIVDYKPATLQPFESVKGGVENLLRQQEARRWRARMARRVSKTLGKVGRLQSGAVKTFLASTRVRFRHLPCRRSSRWMRASCRPPRCRSPGSGYALFKLVKLNAGEALDDARAGAGAAVENAGGAGGSPQLPRRAAPTRTRWRSTRPHWRPRRSKPPALPAIRTKNADRFQPVGVFHGICG